MPNTVKPLSVRKEKSQMKRYRAALLNNPMTLKVVEKSMEIAMDDTHSGQMQAMKLILDRALPVMGFNMEDKAKGAGGIQINITGLTQEKEIGPDGPVTIEQEQDDANV
jgi:hypothetical protein